MPIFLGKEKEVLIEVVNKDNTRTLHRTGLTVVDLGIAVIGKGRNRIGLWGGNPVNKNALVFAAPPRGFFQ